VCRSSSVGAFKEVARRQGSSLDLPSRQALDGALHRSSGLLILAACCCLLPRRLARGSLLVITAAELLILLGPFRFAAPTVPTVAGGEAIAALAGYQRVAIVGNGGASIANDGPLLNIEQPAGYLSLFSRGYAELVTGVANAGVVLTIDPGKESILELLGYAATYQPDSRRLTLVSPPPPLVWVAHCVRPGGAAEVRAPGFPRRSCVTLPAAGPPQEVPPGRADLLYRRAGELSAEADGPGWLVTVEPWYPGWRAWIDGVSSDVEVVDGALVGVLLPPGRHVVELRYIPAGLELGALISTLTLLLLGAIWLIPRDLMRRSAPRPTGIELTAPLESSRQSG
jgi:hypothetical protein